MLQVLKQLFLHSLKTLFMLDLMPMRVVFKGQFIMLLVTLINSMMLILTM